jgi:hypothetical protein
MAIELTLAKGFSLLDGRHEIMVPTNVTSRDDWEIVCKSRLYICLMKKGSSLSMIVFGDSGNVSPAFTILKS